MTEYERKGPRERSMSGDYEVIFIHHALQPELRVVCSQILKAQLRVMGHRLPNQGSLAGRRTPSQWLRVISTFPF